MIQFNSKSGTASLVPILFFIFYLPNFPIRDDLSWHDSQRIGQLILILYCIFLGIIFNCFEVSTKIFFYIFLFVALGFISSFKANIPIWSLTEMAIFFGCYGIGFLIYKIFFKISEDLINILSFLLFFLTASSLALYFFIAYITACFIGKEFNAWDLLNGFSNPRFFGQFCTLVIPVLVAPVLIKARYSGIFYILSCVLFFMAITSGTRGTLLGLGSVTIIFLFTNDLSRRYAYLILKISFTALLMQVIFMEVVPYFLNISMGNNALDRKIISLSLRELLWWQSIGMILENPFFGYGPMHFANMPNIIASHPHQIFFQIFTEWGGIFLFVFLLIFIKLILLIFREIRFSKKNEQSKIIYICLSASILSSLMQSMVDGVFVMPYTEIVFVYILAWLVFEHNKNIEFNSMPFGSLRKISLNMIFIYFGFILLYSFSPGSPTHISAIKEKYHTNFGFLKPRFWLNGEF